LNVWLTLAVIESWVVPSSAATAANQVASDCTCPRFESGSGCGWVPIEQSLGALILWSMFCTCIRVVSCTL